MRVYNMESFKNDAAKCVDDLDIDALALSRLRLAAMDCGKEGEHALKLLDVVRELLSI